MTSPAAQASGRIAWLDLARAASIVLVVLYHVGVGGGADLLGDIDPRAAWFWRNANLALIPLRMPLFFLIAGALAARAIWRPFSQVVRPRILDLLWPYALWSVIFGLTAWPRYSPQDPVGYFGGEITGMLMVGSPYWFIAVLPIFFLLARLGRRSPLLVVGVALIAYAAAPFLQTALADQGAPADLVYGVFKTTDNALWYVLGFALSDRITAATDQLRPRLAISGGAVLTALFCMLAVLLLRGDQSVPVLRGIELMATIVGLAACIALLPLIAQWGALARLGRVIGSRTLVIYLVHPLVLNVVVVLWRKTDVSALTGTVWPGLLLVPAVTALAIAIAILFENVVKRTGPAWLLAAPHLGARRATSRDPIPHDPRKR